MASDNSPRRIACLQPSATVILDRIGELDRVVACTKYCIDLVPVVQEGGKIIVSDSWTASTEQILGCKPDLVIAAVPYQEKALTEILKAGIRFLGLAPKNLADIYTDIATISGVVGASERGEELIRSMQQKIEHVRSTTATVKRRPHVFCEEWGRPLITSQKWVAELVEVAGGEFVGQPGATTTAEDVIQADPDIAIAAWCGAGDRVPLEKIVIERAWWEISAARRGRVFCIKDELLNTPAPTLLEGLDALAYAIRPDIFPRTKGIRQITDVPNAPVGDAAPLG